MISFWGPYEVFAFFALTIGILAGIESAFRVCHLPLNVFQNFFHDSLVAFFSVN